MKMVKLRQNNAMAVFTVLVLLAILFVSFYSMVKPFSMVYTKFTDDSDYIGYLTEADCNAANGYWVDSACQELPERVSSLMVKIRYMWLVAPIILAISLIIWLFVVATRKNPSNYYLGP